MSENMRKFHSPRALTSLIPKLIKPALKKRGLTQGTIILDWPKIVGPQLASRCVAEKLVLNKGSKREGTLYINVDPGSSLLIQHGEPMIIDKINSYFGYKAVAKLKIVQVPLNRARVAREVLKSRPKHPSLPNDIDKIADPELKQALIDLGSWIS